MSRTGQLAFSREEFLAAAERLAPLRPTRPSLAELTPYLEQYRRDALAEDFLMLGLEDAVWLALDLWELNAANETVIERIIRIRRAEARDGRQMRFDVVEIVGPDMAFLVDSAISVCQEARIDIRAVLHPVSSGAGPARSLIQIHIPPLDEITRADLKGRLDETFFDVAAVNIDFPAMRQRMIACGDALARLPTSAHRPAEEVAEARAFIDWLVGDNFTFLGARDYTFAVNERGELTAEEPIVDVASGLGVLRNPARSVLRRSAEPVVLTQKIRDFLNEPSPVIVAKASSIARVHRHVHSDYVGVKRYDARGEVVGETRFLGLFTSEAYTRSATDIPLLRRKVDKVLKGYERGGSRFSLRQLENVLLTYPRDELFQISTEDLARISEGVAHLQVRPRTQLFFRRDRFDRYVSVLLFTPRDAFSSDRRARAHKLLADAFGGRMTAFYPSFGDGPLARVHFIIGVSPGHPEPDEDALNIQVRRVFENWHEAISRAARSQGLESLMMGAPAFPAAYQHDFTPEDAISDLGVIAAMPADADIKVSVRVTKSGKVHACRIFHRRRAIDLSDLTPIFQNMRLHVKDESTYELRYPHGTGVDGDGAVWIHDLRIEAPDGAKLGTEFEQAFEAIWAGRAENDGFNALVVRMGLDWRRASLLRSIGRYRQQTGLDPSEAVQVSALFDHPEIVENILKIFAIKFDPGMPGDIGSRRVAYAPVIEKLKVQMEAVASIDADRVLRRFAQTVLAMTRTNFYLAAPGSQPAPYIVFKIDGAQAKPLPAPVPFRETFVCSPEVEGVHLRFGPVARGGLRWSDRREDFRTEVLGLVKAQRVKNAVIVPVGAKGCFYPKKLSGGTREEVQAAGVSAYRTFVSSLLDLTDNVQQGRIVRPQRLLVWDEDDPYLVVAADKGTATFSDIANEISLSRGFWLGDAFASGGSAGYDHKKMGITARGAWEAVKRHFREMGRDIQAEPFTVVGVGDMSGDVFGNGMLMSRQTRLVAAFDHRHIFFDPNPVDTEAAWNERKRLFDLPRSSWADYNTALLSRGGGVFARNAKTIPLTWDLKQLTGIDADSASPDEVVKALLCADVDLLWFGGIGTYVKAANQTHADAGDKANDAFRVDASRLRARVVGEGANLAMTQAARIEFARKGGRINTDAIDNSAGVDTSDHEVNIKILLADAISSGALAAADRDDLLGRMTDEVGRLVLASNYDQTGALSVMQATAVADLDGHERLMETLEKSGRLSRELEGLPGADAVRDLREKGMGLTRPELAVLMAYAKLDVFDRLIASKAPEDPAFAPLLESYFPTELRTFGDIRNRHRLRREIVATRLANRLVNFAGPCFHLQASDNGGIIRLVQGLEAALSVFGIEDLLTRIDAEDNRSPAAAQLLMRVEVQESLVHAALFFAHDPALVSLVSAKALIERYRPGVVAATGQLLDALSPVVRSRVDVRAERYVAAGAPADLARDVAMLRPLLACKETVDIAARTSWPLPSVLLVQHMVGEALGIDRMRAAVRDVATSDLWERQAIARMANDLPRQHAMLTELAIARARRDGVPPILIDRAGARKLVDGWLSAHRAFVDGLVEPMDAFERSRSWSLAKLVLSGDALREFGYGLSVDPRTP